MKMQMVVTLTGPDRIGLVDRVTQMVLDYHGNVDASKMAHLGGEFAMLMLISVQDSILEKLEQSLNQFKKEGYQLILRQTETQDPQKYRGWIPYSLEVHGADHEGIIHHLTHVLATQQINIERMDTEMAQAPMSGTPLFSMSAVIVVPPGLSFQQWRQKLSDIGDELNVSCELSPFTGAY